MNEIARLVSIVAALLLSGAAAAQTYKCTDRAGKITYSNTECSKLGLKDGGEVRDRLNVNPAYQPPARIVPRQPSVPPAAREAPDKESAAEPPKPERRCFTVKTANGTVTRCNDKPAADDKPEE